MNILYPGRFILIESVNEWHSDRKHSMINLYASFDRSHIKIEWLKLTLIANFKLSLNQLKQTILLYIVVLFT